MFSNFKDVVTVPELAEMLNIGRNTAYELVRAGIVPSVKIGRQIRISKRSVIEYIRPRTTNYLVKRPRIRYNSLTAITVCVVERSQQYATQNKEADTPG